MIFNNKFLKYNLKDGDKMKVCENINVDNLTNVSEKLKPVLKRLLEFVDIEQEKTNSFSEEQILRIINDINSENLIIRLSGDKEKLNYLDKEFKEDPYLKGLYCIDKKIGKIILIKKDDDINELLSTLSHEFEHFVNDKMTWKEKDMEEKIFWETTIELSKEDRHNLINRFEFAEDFENYLGGFSGNPINSSWLELWYEAGAEIIASDRINMKPTSYLYRVEFLKAILKLNDKTIDDFRKAYRKCDISFLFNLMPKNYLLNISKLESLLHNAVKYSDLIGLDINSYASNMIEVELLEYINTLSENENYKINEEDEYEIVTNIANLKLSKKHNFDKDIGELKIYNLETELKNIFNSVKRENENLSSENLIIKINEIIQKQGLLNSIQEFPRMKLAYLKSLTKLEKDKLEKNNEISEIDIILGDLENRIIHNEKFDLFEKGVEKNLDKNSKSYLKKYVGYDKVIEHFVYQGGERYIDINFIKNHMQLMIYSVDIKNNIVTTICENGKYQNTNKIEYGIKEEFLKNVRNLYIDSEENKQIVEEFFEKNKIEIENLFEKGMGIFDIQLTKQEKSKEAGDDKDERY